MNRILAVLSHRPDKVAHVLPHTGFHYRVLCSHNRWRNLSPVMRLLLLPATAWTVLSPLAQLRVRLAVRRFHPDVIMSHGGLAALRARREALRTRARFVMRLGGHVFAEARDNRSLGRVSRLLYRVHYCFLRRNLAAAAHIIVVSEGVRQHVIHEMPRPPETVSVVPTPCDLARFDEPRRGASIVPVLCVSNLSFRPKLDAILEFLPALESLGALIVAPGRYHETLRRATALPVLGFVADIERLYRGAAVLCYFSYLDGCPNVVLEAWASRLPVVANRCSWSEELIRDGQTGLLVDSPTEAVACVRELLGAPAMAAELTRRGYQYVIKHHSEEAVGKQLGVVLRRVLCTS